MRYLMRFWAAWFMASRFRGLSGKPDHTSTSQNPFVGESLRVPLTGSVSSGFSSPVLTQTCLCAAERWYDCLRSGFGDRRRVYPRTSRFRVCVWRVTRQLSERTGCEEKEERSDSGFFPATMAECCRSGMCSFMNHRRQLPAGA